MRNNVFFHCFYGFHVNHHIIIVMFLPFYHKLFKSKMRPKEEEKLQIFFSNFSCSSPITCLFPLCNSSVHSNQRHYQIDFQSFSMKKTFFFVSHWIGDWGRKTLGHWGEFLSTVGFSQFLGQDTYFYPGDVTSAAVVAVVSAIVAAVVAYVEHVELLRSWTETVWLVTRWTMTAERQSSMWWRLPWTESFIPALEFTVDGAPLLMIGTGLDSGNTKQKNSWS